jgi:hypothetical protein
MDDTSRELRGNSAWDIGILFQADVIKKGGGGGTDERLEAQIIYTVSAVRVTVSTVLTGLGRVVQR